MRHCFYPRQVPRRAPQLLAAFSESPESYVGIIQVNLVIDSRLDIREIDELLVRVMAVLDLCLA